MKFTKRAYIKVWQNCPEDELEDTTITLLDYEDANELNSTPVALLYLLGGALIWPDTTLRCINGQPENDAEYYRRILEIYKNNPDPLSCHNCGQRFKYVGQDQLELHASNNRADILRTLKLKAETQPTFDLAEFNQ